MKFWAGAGAALLALAAEAAVAADEKIVQEGPKNPAPRTMTWVGFSVGLLDGSVDVPCRPPAAHQCSESGFFGSYAANLTFANRNAFRLRAVRAQEETAHRPFEIAALAGRRMGKKWYWLLGWGVIRNADNDYEGNAQGVAWEILRAPRSNRGAGFEFSLHGNIGPDADYTGISFGMRFGVLN